MKEILIEDKKKKDMEYLMVLWMNEWNENKEKEREKLLKKNK